MITARIPIHDNFDELTEAIDRQTIDALNEAAAGGSAVAREKSAGTGVDWEVVPAHPTHEGFAAGIRASSPIFRVFNRGSLGKHKGALKHPDRRKSYWEVRRGENPYLAVRRDVDGKGVDAKDITNPARTAGRRILFDRIAFRIRRF